MLDAASDGQDVRALARVHGGAAVRALVAALDNPGERVAAAVALLDFAYGRPLQSLAFDAPGIFVELTTATEAPSHRPNGKGASARNGG
jgi:hypothetical protein